MPIRADGNRIIEVGRSFAAWSGEMQDLLGSITAAVATLQDSWESKAARDFQAMTEEALPHLRGLAEFMQTHSDGLVRYGTDLNYMADTYYVSAG